MNFSFEPPLPVAGAPQPGHSQAQPSLENVEVVGDRDELPVNAGRDELGSCRNAAIFQAGVLWEDHVWEGAQPCAVELNTLTQPGVYVHHCSPR